MWLGMVMVVVTALVALAAIFAGWRWLSARRRRRARPLHPVVLAHGFLGFDEIALIGRRHHYFRRIPDQLTKLGIAVYRPRVAGSASIAVRAEALAAQVRALPDARVNLIAHSMGGLDARYAIAKLGLSDRVKSLTTLGTPHRGTPLADLGTDLLANKLRLSALRKIFDIEAFWDLTTGTMAEFNRQVPDAPGVAYGCVLARCQPPFMNPLLVPSQRYLSSRFGENDGVVPVSSQLWGTVLEEIEADHWAQIGWGLRFDARKLFRKLMVELRARGF
jgi:triacylglycerol lipase